MSEAEERLSATWHVEKSRPDLLLGQKIWSDDKSQNLWLFVHFPWFFLQALTIGLDKESACVLIESPKGDPRVKQLNKKAAELGVCQTMPLSVVCSMGDVECFVRDRTIENQAANKLLDWANTFTPMIVDKFPDGMLMEIKGSLGLFGGSEKLLEKISGGLDKLGYKFNYSVATTPLSAMVIAKAGLRKNVLDRRYSNKDLNEISVDCLDLSARDLRILCQMGIKTLGDCRRLPRKGVIDRFGVELIELLDRLYGNILDPQKAFRFLSNFLMSEELTNATNDWSVLRGYIMKVLEKLHSHLISKVVKTDRLEWTFYGEGYKENVTVCLARPSNNIRIIFDILEEKMNNRVFQGGVTKIQLSVGQSNYCHDKSSVDMFRSKGKKEEESYDDFINRIRSSYGEKSLYNLSTKAAHIPEDTVNYSYSLQEMVGQNLLVNKNMEQKKRPIWLIDPPRKLKFLRNRLFFDSCLSVISERERIVDGWWKGKEIARDYFIARTESKVLVWIYRELDSQGDWYLHGIFE